MERIVQEEITKFDNALTAKGKPKFDYEPPPVKEILDTWTKETIEGFEEDIEGNPAYVYRSGRIQVLLHEPDQLTIHVLIAEEDDKGIIYMCGCFEDEHAQAMLVMQQIALGFTTIEEVISGNKKPN